MLSSGVIWLVSILVREVRGCASLTALSRKITPHLDEVVCNHAQPHPTAHAVQTGIEATSQTVSSFEHANSALRAGSPLFARYETNADAEEVCGRCLWFLVGHRHPPHPQRLSCFL